MATLKSQVDSFHKANGKAGAKGLALLAQCTMHMFDHDDWTPLAWLISKSEGADATRFRAILGQVTGGVTLKKDKNQPTGLRFEVGDNAGPTDKMMVVSVMVDEGVSFRSKRVADELFEAKANPFKLSKYAASVAKKLEKEHVSVNDLMKAMASI